MLIDMKAIAAGPPGTLNAKPGDQVNVTQKLAKLLLQGGFGTRPKPAETTASSTDEPED
jgi:hypothetical protein|tara:strand:+ start:1010 stop:1186 length:177 start_codon:yes stop_codon:yes gene_type:complete